MQWLTSNATKAEAMPQHSKDKTPRLIAGLLLVSGLLHLGLWCFSGQAWEGALSWRKPALFGISGGLTVWSLGWVMTHLIPGTRDKFWSRVMAWSLLWEVGLITLQCWRGVPSHFNDATYAGQIYRADHAHAHCRRDGYHCVVECAFAASAEGIAHHGAGHSRWHAAALAVVSLGYGDNGP